MDAPVFAQILDHVLGDGNHAVLAALASTNPQLAFLGVDVIHGERKTF